MGPDKTGSKGPRFAAVQNDTVTHYFSFKPLD